MPEWNCSMKAFFYTTRLGARAWFLLGIIMAAGMLQTASATIRTFSGTGFWTDTARWTGSTVPVAGDDVFIDGNMTNIASTPFLSSYTLDVNGTNVFVGTNTFLYATNVFISGLMTHQTNSAATTNSLGQWIPDSLLQVVAASNVTVNAGGRIDVSYKGYVLQVSAGTGPGGAAAQRAGGSYAGKGGQGYQGSLGGPTYGSVNAPVDPGSSGSAGGAVGSAGGGVVAIRAGGIVTNNGAILANGLPASANQYGGGSGGSIYIVCSAFAGSGQISASGGPGTGDCGAGGGGRVAINYTNAALQSTVTAPSVAFNLGGRQGLAGNVYQAGEMGTLWLADSSFFPVTTMGGGGVITIPGFTTWNPASLTITNSGVGFPTGFVLNVAGAIAVTNMGELYLQSNATVQCGGDLTVNGAYASLLLKNYSSVLVGGNLVMTNTALLYAYAGPTNGAPPDYGVRVGVTGTFWVASGCFIYPHSDPSNGGSALFTAGNFTLQAGAVINADARGYLMVGATWGPSGPNNAAGQGPGAGTAGSEFGAAYGGRGGVKQGIYYSRNNTYGSVSAPVSPGSSGVANNGSYYGGCGGGAVRLQCSGQVTIDGTITANGTGGSQNENGGGSGGGIYIACSTFKGAGAITARGGARGVSNGGNGGGGRIAVVYTDSATQRTLSPTVVFDLIGGNGTWGNETYAERGTLYFPDDALVRSLSQLQGSYQLVIPNWTNWSLDSLAITNGEVQFPAGFSLNVTNALTICTNGNLIVLSNSTLACGSLDVQNGGKLWLFSGPTNVAGADGGLPVNVTGNMRVETNGFVYCISCSTQAMVWPYLFATTDGGSPLLAVRSLTVDAGGVISADGMGWSGPTNYGGSDYFGFGPGKSSACTGGSHGGLGGLGAYSGAQGGIYVNRSTNDPIEPGSGGGLHNSSVLGLYSAGGGVVRIRAPAGKVTINGTISANGQIPPIDQAGAGAGGSVNILCKSIDGTGVINAKGGNMNSTSSGCGGGGRIAVTFMNIPGGSNFLGSCSASGGIATPPTYNGGVGSIVWSTWSKPTGTLIMMR
jgi:hypothetical protein